MNKEEVIELIGFAIVLLILWRYIAPPLTAAMDKRQEAIANQLAASEAAGQKLAEAQSAYENAVTEARAEAERLIAEAQQQYQAIVSEATAAAQAKADDITARAHEQLEADRIHAVRSLEAEITKMAIELAEARVTASLGDEDRQHRITERFLADLESGALRSSSSGSAPVPGATTGATTGATSGAATSPAAGGGEGQLW
jgi:ATP synthase F0 subunit b